jgi:hypothetical protein
MKLYGALYKFVPVTINWPSEEIATTLFESDGFSTVVAE